MGIPIFFYNESSPYLDYDYSIAFVVHPDGVVVNHYDVSWDSCGRQDSPCTLIIYNDGMSYRSDGSGNIDTVDGDGMQFRNVTDSYGQ